MLKKFKCRSINLDFHNFRLTSGLCDEELLLRAKEERKSIVKKYDQGRGKGNEIPEYEDPKTTNQKYFTDRYGFVQ